MPQYRLRMLDTKLGLFGLGMYRHHMVCTKFGLFGLEIYRFHMLDTPKFVRYYGIVRLHNMKQM